MLESTSSIDFVDSSCQSSRAPPACSSSSFLFVLSRLPLRRLCCVAKLVAFVALLRRWRGCESGGDGEETRRRRRVGKKVRKQLERERESQPCFTLSAMAASACVASSLAVSTSSSLRSSFVRPCSFRERQYAETRFLAAGRCVAQMAMPKLAEAFQSGYGYSIFFFPLFAVQLRTLSLLLLG